MDLSVKYSLIAMVCAGFTSATAKFGMSHISGEAGAVVRTFVVAIVVSLFTIVATTKSDFAGLNIKSFTWLAISGVATAASWIFYYKAIKIGDVSTVALIDKGSILISLSLAWLFLKEEFTVYTILGAAMIIGGLLLVSSSK